MSRRLYSELKGVRKRTGKLERYLKRKDRVFDKLISLILVLFSIGFVYFAVISYNSSKFLFFALVFLAAALFNK